MKKTIFILSHTNGQPGGLDTLQNYLAKNGCRVFRLLHPLDDYNKEPSSFRYPNGEITIIKRHSRGLFNYIEDFYLSVQQIRKTNFDVFLAASNFDALPALFCRFIMRKKMLKIIYYPRDFSEKRFNNITLDFIYKNVEKIAIRYSDSTISNTKRAEKARMALGLDKNKSAVIPNGVQLENPEFIKKMPSKTCFIYVGDVSKEHGLYDLIKVMAPVIDSLVIIGNGNDMQRTVALAKKQSFRLETHMDVKKDYVINYLKKFKGFGLAPYNLESLWTFYCSPLKVNEYIACGVPVLMSDVPEIAEMVQKDAYGIVFRDLDLASIKAKLAKFDIKNYDKRSSKFYSIYSADKLLSRLGI